MFTAPDAYITQLYILSIQQIRQTAETEIQYISTRTVSVTLSQAFISVSVALAQSFISVCMALAQTFIVVFVALTQTLFQGNVAPTITGTMGLLYPVTRKD